jgi:hypothetical protein
MTRAGPVELAVDALAAYRLTRLVIEDRVPFEQTRDWIFNRWPESALAEALGCPWCSGMWVAAGATVASSFAPQVWRPLARTLALSAAIGLLSTWENRD